MASCHAAGALQVTSCGVCDGCDWRLLRLLPLHGVRSRDSLQRAALSTLLSFLQTLFSITLTKTCGLSEVLVHCL